MKIIVFGNNDVSQLAKFYIENDTEDTFECYCVDDDFQKNNETLHWSGVLDKYDRDECKIFAPLYDNKLREKKAKQVKNAGFQLYSYVSSKAAVFSPVGENCFVMENNVIQPFVSIGDNIIMWSGNHIGHHSTIHDNVFFSSHVVLSGHCKVEKYCWFGVNSTIRDHVNIAEGTFVAMSSSVISNTEPYKKYIGNPAKQYGNVEK